MPSIGFDIYLFEKMAGTKHLKSHCNHCGGHIEFPAEAIGTAIACPHCGQTTELFLPPPPQTSILPVKTIVFTIVAVLILVGGLVAAQIALKRAKRLAGNRSNATQKTNATPATSLLAWENGFRISPVTLEKPPGSSLVYATGTIYNETDRRRSGIKVELELLDGTGKKVGTATAQQQTIEPKADWQFKALVLESKAVSARIVSVKENQ